MNCETFVQHLAEALGGELSAADRPAFFAHLEKCAHCRREYESMQATMERIRSLAGPVIATADADSRRISTAKPIGVWRRRVRTWSLHRQAAGILLAFIAGYALHAGLTLRDNVVNARRTSAPSGFVDGTTKSPNLQEALFRAHTVNPDRPDLAKCMSVLFSRSQ
jgi:anti-sigma factor RsiW